ncbi:unnamed protein product, partial [Scytosiphon promiscuus]
RRRSRPRTPRPRARHRRDGGWQQTACGWGPTVTGRRAITAAVVPLTPPGIQRCPSRSGPAITRAPPTRTTKRPSGRGETEVRRPCDCPAASVAVRMVAGPRGGEEARCATESGRLGATAARAGAAAAAGTGGTGG